MNVPAQCQNCGTPVRSIYGYCQRSPECRKLYAKAKSRRYGQTEQRRSYLRDWYAGNRERVLAQQKQYAAENPEKMRERGERWRAANPGYERKRLALPNRQCRQKGCTDIAQDKRLYCKPHANERKRRSSKQKHARTAQVLFDRQAGLCADLEHGGCGQPLGVLADCHIDHLIPQALGGGDEDWNLQLLHARCNRIKQDRIVPAARMLMLSA